MKNEYMNKMLPGTASRGKYKSECHPERREGSFKKKIRILYLLAVLTLCLMSGCGEKKSAVTEENDNMHITVGFSQLGAESDWREANTRSIRSTLSRENGFELLFDDAQQKQDKQIIAIRKFIQQEVDYIVLAPVTETGWDAVLGEAKDAGIPVVIVDRRVDVKDEELFTAWIGSDFAKEGVVACEWLYEYTKAKGISASELRIADIQGTLGATAQIGRTEGIKKGAAKYGWKIVAAEPADYTRAKGREVMERLLRTNPEINVAYCENDNEAIGVIEAIEAAGLKAGADIKNGEILVISFDAARSGLNMVLEGKIALDVECNPIQGASVRGVINSVNEGREYEKYTYVTEMAFSADDTVQSVKIGDEDYRITTLTEKLLEMREY